MAISREIRAAMTDLTRAFTSFSRLSAFFINKFEAKHHFCSKNFVRLFLFCSVVFNFEHFIIYRHQIPCNIIIKRFSDLVF